MPGSRCGGSFTVGAGGFPGHDHHLCHQALRRGVRLLGVNADAGLQQVGIPHFDVGAVQVEAHCLPSKAPSSPQLRCLCAKKSPELIPDCACPN